MQAILNDLRFGLRMLLKNYGFSALGVVTLALGIGGNLIMFGFFNSFFLRPFPFPEPARLVDLDETAPRWHLEYTGLSYASFHAWRESNRSFESMGAVGTASYNFSSGAQVERINGAQVTHDFADVLGIKPVLGRIFSPEEDRLGAEKVVLLSHKLWQRSFGGANVLGQTIRLDQQPYTIIGVLPRDTALLENQELWLPLAENPNQQNSWYLRGIGRLKPGVTLSQAREDLQRIHRDLVAQHKINAEAFPKLTSLSDRYFGPSRLVLHVLLAAGGLLLLIACGNVAALMLARGMARSRELGIRLSLGASSWRVAQMIGLEALLLSACGGALGLYLGYGGLKAVLASLPNIIPGWVHFDFDWRVGLCTLLMVLGAGCLGAFPAIRTVLKSNLQASLQSANQQSTVSGSKRRSLNALVVAELAVTLVLMVQAALLLRAFRVLQQTDPGYRADNLIVYGIALPDASYGPAEKQKLFFRDHLDQVRALPGVLSASAVDLPPLGGHSGVFFEIENGAPKSPDAPDPVILRRIAWPGYFETMGIKLLAGRAFTSQDGINDGARSVVVNDLFAELTWPNQDPLGKRLRYRGDTGPWMTVIGLVRDVKHYGLDERMLPGVYVPFAQGPRRQMSIVARCSVPPAGVIRSIRSLLSRADPELPMIEVSTMGARLSQSMWIRRVYSTLIGVFAGVALAMAIGGIAGVFSYVVSLRTQEMGIRLALGAQRRDLLWLVLRQALGLATIGITIGCIGALSTAPLMRSLLLGVSAADPLTYAGIAAVLAAIALIACWLPARRAMRLQPVTALRHE